MIEVVGVLLIFPAAHSQTKNWVWSGGSEFANTQPAPYPPSPGIPTPNNIPGSRSQAATAIDGRGNFWLFGGGGGSASSSVYFNDLWEFSPTTNEWTWRGGGNAIEGIYGALGVAAPSNVPGARDAHVLWADRKGNIWLFGGTGYDSAGTFGLLNDLWMFDVSKSEWMWVGGGNAVSNTGCQPGVYGTQSVASTGNVPGGRNGAIGWTGSNGNLWLFAGEGCDSTGSQGFLNDLWEFDPGTREWAWVSGSDVVNGRGIYGASGLQSVGNIPSARWYPANMGTDGSGNFWLFGGNGPDSTGSIGFLNDLWEFSPSSRQWTWRSGSATVPPGFETSQSGVYGALGQYSTDSVPGGRYGGVGSSDSKGKLWVFSGSNADASGHQTYFNDLWVFDPSSSEWAWMSGSDRLVCLKYINGYCATYGAPSSYGTLGASAANNVPGGRFSSVGWPDAIGNFWIFGGEGFDSASTLGFLDDLWVFRNPTAVTPEVPLFGTMTFSPTSTEQVGTNQTITISDNITYSGPQPTGVVTYVLNGLPYTSPCTPSSSQNGSPETCTAQIPEATTSALAAGSYAVTGSIAADSNYTAATAPAGTFTIIQRQVIFGTLTFFPEATELQGTNQAITIGSTLTYSGSQPKGAVVYVLDGVSYAAACTTSGSPTGSSETCAVVVPAATIAALPAASYSVTGSFVGDATYATATAMSGTFAVTLPSPDFAISTSGALTLATEHHGRTTISVTPINAFSETVNLSCGPLPTYVTCEWDSATVVVSGGPTSAELTIDTSALLNYESSNPSSRRSHDPSQGWGHRQLLFAALAFPAILPLGRRRKTTLRLILGLLVLAATLELTGCSGRYPGSTPPGIYSIVIMGTSGTLKHTSVLTLVVLQ